jgi:tRNA G18 (ribose-2'-O)-methylase SpoU
VRIVLVLENIRSLHNVGSVFRTADAFGVSKLYLCGYTGAPPRKEIAKVALGAETWVPWEKRPRTAALLRRLRREGYRVVALETGAMAAPIDRIRTARKIALILGNEIDGVSPGIMRMAHEVAEIPMRGRKGSLNVSVAAGIALYALTDRPERAGTRRP